VSGHVSTIEDGLRALVVPGTVFEVRALKVQRNGNGYAATWSGYFDNPDAAARGIADLDGRAVGVYCTLNPTKPELLSRASNRIREVRKDDPTTTDADITRRTRLLVDIDPIRPAGISATDAEHRLARDRAEAIRGELEKMGAPDPLLVDSGNGAQLVYGIDLPADDGGLVRRVLAGLAFRFDDDAAKVDTGNYNPSRIVKVAGTLTRKGDDTVERPHRRAALLSHPFDLGTVPKSILEAVAAWAPAPQTARPGTPRTGDALDLAGWLDRHGIEGRKPRGWRGGVIFDIPCPLSPDHGFDAWVGQDGAGMLSAACFHATCSLKTWRELRDHYEPRRLSAVPAMTPKADAPEEPEYLREELGGSEEEGPAIEASEPETQAEAEIEDDDVTPALPEVLWRSGYKEFRAAWGHTTESPDAFLWSAFFAATGAVLGRGPFVYCSEDIHPNVYVANLGRSGAARKSTGQAKAGRLLAKVNDGILVLRGIGSSEGLIDRLAGEPGRTPGVLVDLGELSTLLRKGKQEATSGLAPLLCTLYDCPPSVSLPNRKNPVEAKDPFLCMIGSTTPDWLRADLTVDDVRGGLAGRFCYFVGTPKAPIPIPPRPDARALSEAERILSEASDRSGLASERVADHDAAALHSAWYIAEKARVYPTAILDTLAQRLHVFAWKAALTFSMLEGTDTITGEQMAAALAFADYQRATQAAVFHGFGQSEAARCAERILAALSKHGPLAGWELAQRVRHVDPEILARAIRNLAQSRRIEERQEGRKRVFAALGRASGKVPGKVSGKGSIQ